MANQFQRINLPVAQRAELLEKSRWSADFMWEDLEILARYMVLYQVARGAVLFRQGDRESFMCLILQGEVKVLKEDSSQKNRVLATVGVHKTLGEMTLIDNQPRSATAVTSEEVTMFLLTRQAFEELADKYPKVWGALLLKIGKLMSQRLRETSGELVDFIRQ